MSSHHKPITIFSATGITLQACLLPHPFSSTISPTLSKFLINHSHPPASVSPSLHAFSPWITFNLFDLTRHTANTVKKRWYPVLLSSLYRPATCSAIQLIFPLPLTDLPILILPLISHLSPPSTRSISISRYSRFETIFRICQSTLLVRGSFHVHCLGPIANFQSTTLHRPHSFPTISSVLIFHPLSYIGHFGSSLSVCDQDILKISSTFLLAH